MADNNILIGAGAGIFGLLVGFGLGGPDGDDIVDAVGAKLDTGIEASASAGSEQAAAMGAEIAELKTAIAGMADGQAASEAAMNEKLDAAVAALTGKIDGVSTTVGALVNEAGTLQTANLAALLTENSAVQTSQIEATLSGGMDSLKSSISQMAALAPAAAEDAADATAETAAAAPAEPEIEGTKVGQTESLMDGKVRVFVSGLDAEAQTVRVAVNGLGLQTMGQYQPLKITVDDAACHLKLDGIEQGHVQMSASCPE